MCIFIGCWSWSIKGHTQIASNPRQITSADLFFFFHAPKAFYCIKKQKAFYCIKQIDNIFPCVYCNRSQKTSLRLVSYFFVLYTLWRYLWSITVHTQENVIYLLISRNILVVYCKHCNLIGYSTWYLFVELR